MFLKVRDYMLMLFTTPYVIIIALILVLLITLTISLSFIYYIKRKYDLLEKYKKQHRKKAKKKLNKELNDLDFKTENFFKTIINIIINIIRFYIEIRGSM